MSVGEFLLLCGQSGDTAVITLPRQRDLQRCWFPGMFLEFEGRTSLNDEIRFSLNDVSFLAMWLLQMLLTGLFKVPVSHVCLIK